MIVNRAKNILLVLLTLSAVTLFYFSLSLGIYGTGGSPASVFGRVLGGAEVLNPSTTQEISFSTAALPYRICIIGENGMFAASDADEYELLRQRTRELFIEAVASAHELTQISESEFMGLLSCPAIYMRYDGDLPFSLLRSWADTSFSGTELAVRSIAVSGSSGDAVLLLSAPDGTYYSMETASSVSALSEICAGSYIPNARFAASQPSLRALAPDEVLIDYSPPSLPAFSVSHILYTDTQELSREVLKAFSFNPYLVRVYSDASGSYVYVDEKNSLRVNADGTLLFAAETADGGGIPLPYPYPDSSERLAFICESVRGILADVWTYSGAFGQLSLSAVEYSPEECTLVFEINLDGFAVDLLGCNAARTKVLGDVITEISICPRMAAPQGSKSFIPYAQSAAALSASGGADRRLAVRYTETEEGLLLPVMCSVSEGE